MDNIRVRFAPSPTGPLHIGGLRTALFNYLFARKYNGKFILRIEDTDRNRFDIQSEKHIFDSIKWLGLDIDESIYKEQEKYGSYKQSERINIYKQYVQELIDNKYAYYAFDTPKDLENIKKEYQENKRNFIYNHSTRSKMNNSLNMDNNEVQKILENTPYVVRFKMPENKKIEVQDIIKNKVTFDSNLLDDKILYKSDGMPTYHLANIVDDHLMEISHVIRGEEWLSSTGLHVLLYEAFNWKKPAFAHLPLILNPNGKGKLSKRNADKLGIPILAISYNENIGYKEKGYFNDVLFNFLALLGWNSGNEKEIYNKKELIEDFDIKRVNKSGAKFDIEKLNWYNHQYLQQKKNSSLIKPYQELLLKHNISENNPHKLEKIISLIKERANLINDFIELSDYIFIDPKKYNNEQLKKCWDKNTQSILKDIIEILKNTEDKIPTNELSESIKNYFNKKEIPLKKIMQPLRIALVGELKGIDLFELINLINKDISIQRIENLIKYQYSKS